MRTGTKAKMMRMMRMTNKNFNHLMLLYEKAYKMCSQVREIIENGKIEDLDDILRNKGEVFKSILRFEKTVKTNEEEESKRLELRKKIEEFERVNIELLKQRQENLKKELQKVSRGKKITKAYMASPPVSNSSIDIRE